MAERRTVIRLIRFHPEELTRITEHAPVVGGLPPWLATFLREAVQETDTLRENGADHVATARMTLLKKLLTAASAWLDAELDTAEAAQETGRCEETIRRAVRDGTLPDRRAHPRGQIRVRRGDLQKLAAPPGRSYDPTADAQDIAKLRRQL